MKKIERILPLGEFKSRSLACLKPIYLENIRYSGTDPIYYLKCLEVSLSFESACRPKLDFVRYLIDKFDDIVIAEPQELEQFIEVVDNQGWQLLLDSNKSFNEAVRDAFGYKTRFRGNIRRGVWYAEMLNLKTCPYCNTQYTLIVNGTNKKLAKFQFDHFFSKSRYPFLSLSMYNLIPSCASCNLAKTSKDYNLNCNYHPYHFNLADYLTFKIVKPGNIQNLSIRKIRDLKDEDIEISLNTPFKELDAFVRNHYIDFDFEGMYNRHKDIVREMIIKSKLYQGKGITYPTYIEGLFEDQHSIMHYLLGNYMRADEILERPLSKMMQDLALQLDLIKHRE